MSHGEIGKRSTTRRGFVKSAAAGVGGIALASSLEPVLRPGQGGVVAASAADSKYQKEILVGK